MARLQQVNDTASTLGAEAPATQEYIVLATGDGAAKGYPETGDYIVRIGNGLEAGSYEYKRVTGRVTDTLSFTGGLSYTWPVGTPVWIAISQADFTELWAAIDLKAPSTGIALSALATQAADSVTANVTDGAASPAAYVVDEQELLGRITGGRLAGLTATQVRTLLNVADGATAFAIGDAVQAGAITDDVVKAPTHDAVYEALALKAPTNPVATDSLYTAEGDVAVGSGTSTATKRNILKVYAHGNCGAEETFDLSAYAKHSATIDQAATTINITDPGDDRQSSIRLTPSADSALTWQKTGGGGTFVWANDAELATVTNGNKVLVWIDRQAADSYWLGYMPIGWTE